MLSCPVWGLWLCGLPGSPGCKTQVYTRTQTIGRLISSPLKSLRPCPLLPAPSTGIWQQACPVLAGGEGPVCASLHFNTGSRSQVKVLTRVTEEVTAGSEAGAPWCWAPSPGTGDTAHCCPLGDRRCPDTGLTQRVNSPDAGTHVTGAPGAGLLQTPGQHAQCHVTWPLLCE